MFKIYSQQLSNMQYGITNCSHHAAHYIPMIYLFLRDRERQSMSRGGAQRERETQDLKQALGSELSAQSPMQGLNS